MDERSGKDDVGCCRKRKELAMVQTAMSEGLAAVALSHLAYEVVSLQMRNNHYLSDLYPAYVVFHLMVTWTNYVGP